MKHAPRLFPLGLLFIGTLLIHGCAPSQAYVAADRASIEALADGDPCFAAPGDPPLTEDELEDRRETYRTAFARIEKAEGVPK